MPQPLHPITLLDPAAAAVGGNPVAPGNLVVIPLIMAANTVLLRVVQVAMAQDRSLRLWVSARPGGTPIPPIASVADAAGNVSTMRLYPDFWHAHNDMGAPFLLFTADAGHGTDATFSDVAGVLYVLVPNGMVYINVLNLSNEPNMFVFKQDPPA